MPERSSFRQRRFGRYVAISDGYDRSTRTATAAVLDRTTGEPVKGTERLPACDAAELARNWNQRLEDEASALTSEPRPRCYCGHAQRSHINGEGLCLTCPGVGCLIFRAAPSRTEASQ